MEKWTGEVSGVPNTRRIGYAPEELPADGEWYVLRTEEGVGKLGARLAGSRITQAASYIRRRQRTVGDWPGFEVARVDEDTLEGKAWHLIGRWT